MRSGSPGPGPCLIEQAYRFALAPTSEQEGFLISCAGASRFWFNQGLALVKERLDQRKAGDERVDVPWSYKSLCSAFAPLKDEVCPWRAEVVVGSMQAGLEQLGRALQSFSRGRREGRRVGFPRFRVKGRSRESIIFQRPRIPDNRHVMLHRRLGPIRTRESLRKLTRLLERDQHARILRSTVQRGSGDWVISFTVQRSPKQRRARQANAAVGVDLGLASLATLSTGQKFVNSRPLEAALRRLARYERQLDRQRRANNPDNYEPDGNIRPGPKQWRSSGRMRRTQERLRGLHARVANLRREQAHQLTTTLTREFGIIGVETLAVKNLMGNRHMARQIADAGWGLILGQLAYKTAWSAESLLVAANRYFPSSKTCSACGTAKAKLVLAERVFTCDCGLVLDRDLNAALNLARMAAQHAQGEGIDSHVAATGAETSNARREQVRPVAPSDRHSSMKREAPPRGGTSQRRKALALAT